MNLEAIFHEFNALHFGSEMPLPKLVWNSRLSSSAGRFGPGLKICPNPVIEVATYLRDIPEGEMHVRDTVLHEMIHYWLWHRGLPYGHTPEFHAKLRATGAKRFNPVPKERPIKHYYVCRNCETVVPARRQLQDTVACARCCSKFNGGRYSRNFRLDLLTDPNGIETAAAQLETERQRKIAAAGGPTAGPGSAPSCESEDDDENFDEALILPIERVMEKLESIRELLRNATIRK